ncbi:MAG TPA: membrane protein insertase YidC [Streptosporangiaceae bacterium]|jgi:YidC/Oxa1 family membrane protein insertase
MSVFSALFGVPVDAAYHVVSAVAGVLTPVLGGLAAAAAIVAFTMAVRLLTLPLSFRSMRGLAAQARIAPQVQALRAKHSRHPDRLQRELAALYQAEGTSMFAGCLPLLLQWPFLSVMYLLFRSPRIGGKVNTLLSHSLFGTPLGSHWLAGVGPFSAQGAVFAALFLLLAAAAWLSVRVTRRLTPTPASPATDPTARLTAALTRLTPYGTVVIAAFLPLAAGLYLATTTAWTLAERTLLRRSASPAGATLKVREG